MGTRAGNAPNAIRTCRCLRRSLPISRRKQLISCDRGRSGWSPRSCFREDGFPEYGFRGNLEKQGLLSETGRILSRWDDGGWGRVVARNRSEGRFEDRLVDAAASLVLNRWKPIPEPGWVACVPSLSRPAIVPEFARRLAHKLGIPFLDAVHKVRQNAPQKEKNNRFHQCRNLDGIFKIRGEIPAGSVLLVDDTVDSGWTLAVVGALLRKAGCARVLPLALATTAGR